MEHPRCMMMADVLTFAHGDSDQCTREGEFRHPWWPLVPLCGFHFQGFVNLTCEANKVAADSQSRASQEESQHASNGNRRVMGTLIDDPRGLIGADDRTRK